MNEFKPLPREFYLPSAKVVAPKLLGHWLLRRTEAGLCGGPIVETEAYIRGDAACHGAPGLTPRNRVMFGEPGHAYVYFIYGNHYCMNVVCCPKGVAEAVLIRAIEPEFGLEVMEQNRKARSALELTNGPGKLCQAMDIERVLDGADLCDSKSVLFVAENPRIREFRRKRTPLVTGKRIGLTKAAELLLRFYLEGSKSVS
jgi:DNA-3-methyladenine glycosylase